MSGQSGGPLAEVILSQDLSMAELEQSRQKNKCQVLEAETTLEESRKGEASREAEQNSYREWYGSRC